LSQSLQEGVHTLAITMVPAMEFATFVEALRQHLGSTHLGGTGA